MTMDYIVIESKTKNETKAINSTSRNTQRLSVKMNRFSNSLAENDNNVVIDMNQYDSESLNYLKRTISSTMKDKQNSASKSSRLKSNLSPSSSESILTKIPGIKTRNHIEPSNQMTSNQQASIGSPMMPNEPKIKVSKEKKTISDLNNQSNSSEASLNLDYYNKANYISTSNDLYSIDRRKFAGSSERQEIADRHTECTSANQCRERSKPRFNSKDPIPCKEELVRLYDDDKKSSENDDAAFKAKHVPKSHKIPHMIFHSIKGLTQPQEFRFHYQKKDKNCDTEDVGEREDDDAHMIISNEYVQKSPQQKSKSDKKQFCISNEVQSKRKAFNYHNEDQCESHIKETNRFERQNIVDYKAIDKDSRPKGRRYDIKELLIKVKEHAKKCKDKYNNKNISDLDLEQFEKDVDKIIESEYLKNDNMGLKVTDSIELISNFDSQNFDKNRKTPKIQNYLDISIGSMLSSSISSNYNMQTVTLSSVDNSEFTINKENIFGGMCDIDEIIKEQEDAH